MMRAVLKSSQRLRFGLNPRPGQSGFSHVEIAPDDVVDRRVSFRALLHTHLTSPTSALKTLMLRATQISSLSTGLRLTETECEIRGPGVQGLLEYRALERRASESGNFCFGNSSKDAKFPVDACESQSGVMMESTGKIRFRRTLPINAVVHYRVSDPSYAVLSKWSSAKCVVRFSTRRERLALLPNVPRGIADIFSRPPTEFRRYHFAPRKRRLKRGGGGGVTGCLAKRLPRINDIVVHLLVRIMRRRVEEKERELSYDSDGGRPGNDVFRISDSRRGLWSCCFRPISEECSGSLTSFSQRGTFQVVRCDTINIEFRAIEDEQREKATSDLWKGSLRLRVSSSEVCSRQAGLLDFMPLLLRGLCSYAFKVKKRGSDMGDNYTHAWDLIAPTRKACSVSVKVYLRKAIIPHTTKGWYSKVNRQVVDTVTWYSWRRKAVRRCGGVAVTHFDPPLFLERRTRCRLPCFWEAREY
ncbi:hypothetical protein PR048_032442 [Dryococelus australis]|uniref:Uncharacterized protein n=1 Tax=Dryococelus australis TaxID=614101 RepID=A0ABQ9G313_9NEOP|nr:hypothetical protein PR048_032442 [Dryococelus australis]